MPAGAPLGGGGPRSPSSSSSGPERQTCTSAPPGLGVLRTRAGAGLRSSLSSAVLPRGTGSPAPCLAGQCPHSLGSATLSGHSPRPGHTLCPSRSRACRLPFSPPSVPLQLAPSSHWGRRCHPRSASVSSQSEMTCSRVSLPVYCGVPVECTFPKNRISGP